MAGRKEDNSAVEYERLVDAAKAISRTESCLLSYDH